MTTKIQLATIESYHEHISSQLSQEALTGMVPNLNVVKRLQEMFFGTKEFITQQFSGILSLKSASKIDLEKLIKIANQVEYTSMSSIEVLNPLRLSKPWLEYAGALKTLQDVTAGIDRHLLHPFNTYIGKGINNPMLFSQVTYKPEHYKLVEVEPYKKDLEKYLNGPNRETCKWKQAFKRNADVTAFASIFNDVLTQHANISPETVKKSVDILNGNIEALMTSLSSPSTEYVLSNKSISFISELILQTAKHVELYTITHQLICEMERCALKTQDAINIA